MRRSFLVVIVILLAMAAAAPVLAQSVVSETEREAARGVPDRWGFSLGSFWQTFNAKVRLDGTSGEIGSDVDLESDLDLPNEQTNFSLAGFYRFSDHHRLDLFYTTWSRSRSVAIDRQIEWGDVIYDVGAVVSSDTSGDLLNAIYKYSFYNNGKVVFGLNGGISAMWSTIELSGEGTVVGGGTASATLAEKKSTIFPIPVIGVHFEMTLTKKLFWRAEGNFFAATISGYDGNVNEITTSVDYYFTRNIGVGAGYATTAYKVNYSGGSGGDIRARFGFGGPTLYATFVF